MPQTYDDVGLIFGSADLPATVAPTLDFLAINTGGRIFASISFATDVAPRHSTFGLLGDKINNIAYGVIAAAICTD